MSSMQDHVSLFKYILFIFKLTYGILVPRGPSVINDVDAQRANVTGSMNSKLCNTKPRVQDFAHPKM